MSLVNDFNILEEKLDGINLSFFTFFTMFQVYINKNENENENENENKNNENKNNEERILLWCGYPISKTHVDPIIEYIEAQIQWIQQKCLYVPDYNTGDFMEYKIECQRRMTFLVNTLYKLKFGEYIQENNVNCINILQQIRELSKL